MTTIGLGDVKDPSGYLGWPPLKEKRLGMLGRFRSERAVSLLFIVQTVKFVIVILTGMTHAARKGSLR